MADDRDPGAPPIAHGTPVVPAVLFALTGLLALAAWSVLAGNEPLYDTALYPLNGVLLGLSGLLILSRHRAHAIGWLLTGMGVLAAATEVTEGYGHHPDWPAATPIQWSSQWTSITGASMTTLILVLFPDGRVAGRRWRPLLVVGITGVVLSAFSYATGHGADDAFSSGSNPYAIGSPVIGVIGAVANVCFLISLLGGFASLIVRYRRAGSIERQQLKWVAYVMGLLALVGPFAIFFYFDSALVRIVIAVVVTLIPVVICVAILRYRLYDIDLLISRTIAYVVLTVLVAGTFVAIALGLGAVLGGDHPSYVTAAATLVAAIVFLPLRGRVQDLVDRRFRRARHDALSRIDRFLADLRTGREVPEALEPVLREILDCPDLTIRYVIPAGSEIDAHGVAIAENRSGADVPETGVSRTTMERNGVRLAVVLHEQLPESSPPQLLADVLERAALAIEIARLRAEVNASLAQVRASRARIVAAGQEERRRLERDLHDGAQQRLVSAGLTLRHAQHELRRQAADPGLGQQLDVAVGQITEAIGELRELANGVRPARLDDGLDGALRELASRTPLLIDVRNDNRDTGSRTAASEQRYPPDVEATAYFVACEALTNAVKHSGATSVTVATRREAGHLVLTIRDDGVGGARPGGGSGLRGLVERVAAHGGRFDLDSPPGAGTTLIAELPCR